MIGLQILGMMAAAGVLVYALVRLERRLRWAGLTTIVIGVLVGAPSAWMLTQRPTVLDAVRCALGVGFVVSGWFIHRTVSSQATEERVNE